ncbi:MAG: hypothetical protein JO189_29810 [Deltaproteobacteria bacterium]|nr:hypothetical protein [Deltaproteobacteria bacterium]
MCPARRDHGSQHKKATHGCAAGTGDDQVYFRVSGTTLLASTLRKVTDRQLTITGPITISGGGAVQVMQVALGARLNLMRLGIANGNNVSTGKGGGIDNSFGTLAITNSNFADNSSSVSSGGGNFSNERGAAASIKSTILAAAGNSSGNCAGTITDTGYNISDDSTCNFSATGTKTIPTPDFPRLAWPTTADRLRL